MLKYRLSILKGIVHPKTCHHLLTLKLFQTCVSFFLLLNTKEDILKNTSFSLSVIHLQAFGQAYTNQRKVAEDGETNEETLLQESASKEAYYMGRLVDLQSQLNVSSSVASNAQTEAEHLNALVQEFREVSCVFSFTFETAVTLHIHIKHIQVLYTHLNGSSPFLNIINFTRLWNFILGQKVILRAVRLCVVCQQSLEAESGVRVRDCRHSAL